MAQCDSLILAILAQITLRVLGNLLFIHLLIWSPVPVNVYSRATCFLLGLLLHRIVLKHLRHGFTIYSVFISATAMTLSSAVLSGVAESNLRGRWLPCISCRLWIAATEVSYVGLGALGSVVVGPVVIWRPGRSRLRENTIEIRGRQ